MFSGLSNLHGNQLEIEDVKECLRLTWEAIPQDDMRWLIDSMPDRMDACRHYGSW
jgi:hypothetical protein